jgi:hypothetical protein
MFMGSHYTPARAPPDDNVVIVATRLRPENASGIQADPGQPGTQYPARGTVAKL